MNFKMSQIPERTAKPRKSGLTMVMDKGLSYAEAENFLSVAGVHTDLIKLGFGTSFVTPNLRKKIELYQAHGIPVYFGGTLFEAYIVRNQFEDYITLEDIKKYKLLKLDPQFITVPNFDAVAQAHGLETKIEFEMANYEILKKFVKAGVGIVIVSSICLEDESDKELIGRDLSSHFPSLIYGIMVKKGKILHPLLKKFIEMLKESKLLQAHKKNN